MTVIKTTALALMALLISATVAAGHHEKGEGPMLAAMPGQIMIVYYLALRRCGSWAQAY